MRFDSKWKWAIAGLLPLAAPGAVAAGQDAPAVAAPAEQPASTPALPAGTNLVIYRAYAQPTAWQPTVKIDGVKLVALPNRHYTATHVAAGTHKVKLSWPFLSGQSDAAIDVTIAEGELHYLEVTGISQLAGMDASGMYFNMGSGIAEVKPEYAAKAVVECCEFKAGKGGGDSAVEKAGVLRAM